MEDVKLLGHWPSPYVMRTRIALNLKSVEYSYIEHPVPPVRPVSELLLKCNPIYKKIPVLLHRENPVCESLNIVQYIDEFLTSSPSILPSDPYERAVHRFWAAYVDNTWFRSLCRIAKARNEEARLVAMEQVERGLAILEEAFAKCSKGKAFFGGSEIGYLDIALGSCLGWVRVSEKMNNFKLLDEARVPGPAAWAKIFCAHEAVKGVMPEVDKLIEFAKAMYGYQGASNPLTKSK